MARVRQAKGQGTISCSKEMLAQFGVEAKDLPCINIQGVFVIEEGREEEVHKALNLNLEEYNHPKSITEYK